MPWIIPSSLIYRLHLSRRLKNLRSNYSDGIRKGRSIPQEWKEESKTSRTIFFLFFYFFILLIIEDEALIEQTKLAKTENN